MFAIRIFVVASLFAIIPASASAQSLWQPQTGGDWLVPANWDTTVPNAVGAWAKFGWTTGSQVVNVNNPITLAQITFGDTINPSNFNYTISGQAITFNNNTSPSGIQRKNTDGESIVLAPIIIAGNNNFFLAADGFANAPSQVPLTIASLSGTNSNVSINSGSQFPGIVIVQSGNYGGANSITTIWGGVLRANEGVGLPTNTNLWINAGVWELGQATTITRTIGTAAGNIRLPNGASGFAAYDGQLNIRLNNGTGQVQWGTSTFNPSQLRFGRGVTATGATDVYVFENGLDLNGANRTVAIAGGGVRALVRFTNTIANTSANPSALILTGGGTAELTGTNTYLGTTSVQQTTVLRANEGTGLSPNMALNLNNGTLEGLGTTTFSRLTGATAGRVIVLGASGFSAFNGTHTIRLNNNTAAVVWGSGGFAPTNFQFGSLNANSMTDFQNGIDLNGSARQISTRDNPNSTGDFTRISGAIANSTGTAALIVGGNGITELTGVNSHNGETVIFDSAALPGTTLRLAGTGSFAKSPVVTVGATRFLDVSTLTGGANYSFAASRFAVAGDQTLAGSGTVIGNVLVGDGATIRGGSPASTLNDPTGRLTVNGSLRIGGSGFAPATMAVDLNGASTTGATVSRIAVAGAGNAFDLNPGGGVTLQLLNDQALVAGQSYTFVVGSSEGGFTRNGTPVTEYVYGTDFQLLSSNFASFSNVTLTVDGSNLVLGFTPTPVPEPACLIGIAAALTAAIRFGRRMAF